MAVVEVAITWKPCSLLHLPCREMFSEDSGKMNSWKIQGHLAPTNMKIREVSSVGKI